MAMPLSSGREIGRTRPAPRPVPALPLRFVSLRLEGNFAGNEFEGEDGSAPDGATVVLSRSTFQELRAALAELAALSAAERWHEMADRLLDLGRRLGAILRPAISSRGEGRPLEVALQVHGQGRDQGLKALPWELALDPEGFGPTPRFLFAPGADVLTRVEEGLRAPVAGALPSPLAVSLLAEKAAHFGLSDLSESARSIQAALGPGGEGAALAVGTLRATPSRVRPTQVLHLLAHGYETGGIDARFEYGLHCASLRDFLPEDCYGEAPAEVVAAELRRHTPWKVLILDACYTGGGFRWDGERWSDPLCTLAARLGGSLVVSFFEAVDIRRAQTFARNFYGRLEAGDSPLQAACAARDALFRIEAGSPLHKSIWWKVRVGRGR